MWHESKQRMRMKAASLGFLRRFWVRVCGGGGPGLTTLLICHVTSSDLLSRELQPLSLLPNRLRLLA